jgi:hypothetical protein
MFCHLDFLTFYAKFKIHSFTPLPARRMSKKYHRRGVNAKVEKAEFVLTEYTGRRDRQ